MTRERIVDAALAVVETDGVDRLSMRKLAAELGIAPTSIYWHVGGREELLDAVVERYSSELVARAIRGRTPSARVIAVARQFRDDAIEHPELTTLAHERGLGATVALPLQLALARELTRAGLRGRRAGRAMRSILFTIGGFILLESRLGHVPPDRGSVALWRDVDDPSIDRGVLAEMRGPADFDRVFDDTLGALVASLLAA